MIITADRGEGLLFSSRRRHTRCALVTGVQTCALPISCEPGLSQRSRSVREHLATRVYARGLVETAGKMDLSPSKLTEKLAGSASGGKPRGLTIDELEASLQRTGDLSPVHYLVEKYLNDHEIAQA